MKLDKVEIGCYYTAKVSGAEVPVEITGRYERTRNYYGWAGSSSQCQTYFTMLNLSTGVEITGRASRLRRAINADDVIRLCCGRPQWKAVQYRRTK